MALKDCTFTVNVGGKAQVMDYDQLRLFLMQPKNMAAVSPTFAGRNANVMQEAEPTQAPSTLMQAGSPRKTTWPTVNLFPTMSSELTEENLGNISGRSSSVKTGKEARELLKSLARANNEQELEIKELKRKMNEIRLTIVGGARGKSLEQKIQLETDFVNAVNSLKKANNLRQLQLIDAIAPGGLADITWDGYQTTREEITTGQYSSRFLNVTPGISKEAQKRINLGVLRFQRIVGANPKLKGKKINVRIISPFEAENDNRFREHFSPYSVDDIDKLKGEALPGEGHVALMPNTSNSTIVHELGHWMEHAIPEITEMTGRFLKRRGKSELLSTLNALKQSTSYDDRELAVKDKFIDAYIGKYYGFSSLGRAFPGQKPGWDKIYASEVLSMGVQYLLEDPVKFAKEDPEMFDLIYDILRIGR